jgi:hypothetical protein
VHLEVVAGYGSKRLCKDCGDNVGTDRLPAGARSNLQGPIGEAKAIVGGRDSVLRMSQYER